MIVGTEMPHALSGMTGRAIGLDIGGTKIAAGVVAGNGTIIDRLTPMSTPSGDQGDVVRALGRLIGELRSRHAGVEAIGVGAAGLVDWPDGYIKWAPNNAYRGLPLRNLLQESTGLRTIVDNDANAAAWAEASLGHRERCMVVLTVGTGIGGGLVFDGELFRGRTGLAAEVGHIIVDTSSSYRCGCGNSGCLEALASGVALGRYGREAATLDPRGMIAQLARDPESVTALTVHEAARSGDPTACSLFERVAHWMGVGIASLVNLLDPEMVVIGGGLSAAGDLLLGHTRASFERMFAFARRYRELPPIELARLGVDAGWVGAAMLALDRRVPDTKVVVS